MMKKRSTRNLRVESLESRRVLAAATDLASITGRVFDDFLGNGFDLGEEVSGAMLELYLDDGDGEFEPDSDDGVLRMTMSGSDGRYQFARLPAAGYFVVQPLQTGPSLMLQRSVSSLITISNDDVQGQIVTQIDSFDITEQTVVDSEMDGQPVTSSRQAPEAIGGERDLFVNKTSENGSVQLSVNSALLPNQLSFDSISTGAGQRRITWDGEDGNALVVDDTGLGGVDFSDAEGLQLQIRSDLDGGTATIRIYNDDLVESTADLFATATVPIPAGASLSTEFIPLGQFVPNGNNIINLAAISAIELEITGVADVNGAANLVGAVGNTIFEQNFDNFETADLNLAMTVDDPAPLVDQEITYTVTIRNEGPDIATGVLVDELLPEGIQFVGSLPTQGQYDANAGLWSVGTISAFSSETLTITAKVTSIGAKTNTVRITSAGQIDRNETNNFASVTVTPQTIDLSLAKRVDDASPNVGQEVTFTTTVSNAGPDGATGVSIRESLAPGLTLVSADPGRGNFNTSTGVWTIPNVDVDESVSISITATVDATGLLASDAEVIAADQTDINSTPDNDDSEENDQDSVAVSALISDLSLSQQVDVSRPNVGDEIEFTVIVSNDGPNPATGVRVADMLPAGITPLSSIVNAGNYRAIDGIWDIGDVAVGATPTLMLRGRVDTSEDSINTAEIIAADQFDPDSIAGNDAVGEDDQETVLVDPQVADLSLSKTLLAVSRPNIGDQVTFQIEVVNDGPDAASNLVVLDSLPAGLSFLSSNSMSFDDETGQWSIGDLDADETATLTIVARVDATTDLINSAEVFSVDQFDPDSTPNSGVGSEDDQDSATVTTASADLSLTKTADNSTPNVGQDVTFTITVNNSGPDQATGISVRDRLPQGLELVSADESSGDYDINTGVWTIESIANLGFATLTLVATATSTDLVTNSAEIIASDQDDPDSDPDNGDPDEDDFAQVEIRGQQIDLSLTKIIDVVRPNVGDNVTIETTLRNDGPAAATGVIVTDTLPAGVSLVESTPQQGTFDPTTGQWNAGSLDIGEETTLTIIAKVDQILGQAVNTAEVTSANQPDLDSIPGDGDQNDDDQDSVSFSTPVADLSLTKTASDTTPNVGDRVTFEIVLTNEGPDAATGVVVNDLLPSGLAFESDRPTSGTYDSTSGDWVIGTVSDTETLLITAVVMRSGSFTNSAQVTTSNQADNDSTPGNNDDGEDDQDSATVIPQVIDLSLTKTADTLRPALGSNVVFTVEIANDGPAQASNIVVRDVLPSGMMLLDFQTTAGTYQTTSGLWNVSPLERDGSETLRLLARVIDVASQTNTAEIIAADQLDSDSNPDNGDATEDDQASVTINTASADLALTQSIDNSEPNVGQSVTFVLTVTNDGPDAADQVAVRDLLPAGLTLVSADPESADFDPDTGVWTLPAVVPDSTHTISLTARVDSAGEKTNVAEIISSSQFDPDSTPAGGAVDEDDRAAVSLTPQLVDLALNQSISDERPNVGDTIEYLLTLTNDGPTGATGVEVTDLLPAGVTFDHAITSQGTYDPDTGIWDVGSIAVAASPTLRIGAVVGNTTGATNTAEVTAADQPDDDSTPNNQTDSEDDQASTTFTTRVADLALSKTVDDSAPGENQIILFTLTLSNDGPDDASSVVVQDRLPTGLSFQSANPSHGDYDPDTGLWSLQSIAASTDATLQIAARVESNASTTNVAEIISSRQLDSDSTAGNSAPDEDDFASVTVTPPLVDVSVAASVDNDAPAEGDVIEITITATNAAPATATGVVLSALLPDNLTAVAGDPEEGSYDATTGIWNLGELAGNSSANLIIRARVGERGFRQIPVQITAIDQFDADAEDDQTETIIRAPQILSLRLFLAR